MNENHYEIAIIGGGPAGLSAALIFGRSLTSTVVISEEKARHKVTQASHGFITRDGIHPIEFLKIAKQQLQLYPCIDYVKARVTNIRFKEHQFVLTYDNGKEIHSNKLIIATGLKDDLDALKIKNLKEAYGKSIFVCPFCDAWEWKHKKLALIGEEYAIFEYAKVLSRWSKDLTIFTNGHHVLSSRQKKELEKNQVKFIEEKITAFHSNDGYLHHIELKSGKQIEREAAFIPHKSSNSTYELLHDLAVDIEESIVLEDHQDYLHTTKRLKQRNIYIIGDAKNQFSSIIGAASEAYQLAKQITYELAEESWEENTIS